MLSSDVGEGTRVSTTGYTGRPIRVESHRRRPRQISAWLREAGFAIEAEMLTEPYADRPGAMVFARRQA